MGVGEQAAFERRREVELAVSSFRPDYHKVYQLNDRSYRGKTTEACVRGVAEEKMRMAYDLDKHCEVTTRCQNLSRTLTKISSDRMSALERERPGAYSACLESKDLL